jgi:hypothetical protein
MTSRCQPSTKGVFGSTTGHAWRTKSLRLRCASSRRIAGRSYDLGAEPFEGAEFVEGEGGVVSVDVGMVHLAGMLDFGALAIDLGPLGLEQEDEQRVRILGGGLGADLDALVIDALLLPHAVDRPAKGFLLQHLDAIFEGDLPGRGEVGVDCLGGVGGRALDVTGTGGMGRGVALGEQEEEERLFLSVEMCRFFPLMRGRRRGRTDGVGGTEPGGTSHHRGLHVVALEVQRNVLILYYQIRDETVPELRSMGAGLGAARYHKSTLAAISVLHRRARFTGAARQSRILKLRDIIFDYYSTCDIQVAC